MSIYNGRRIPVYYDDGNVGNAASNAIASGLTGSPPGAWGGTTPPSDVAGRAAPGGLAPQLGTQNADPTRNIGRNPDGSLVPVNSNPQGWGLAQGAGQAAAAPGVTPTAWSGMTGGHTGSTYNIAGFNPWTNLAQYNGGVYQTGGGDRGQANTPGGEDDMNRVFRWTNDILKAKGIDQNSPEAAQVFAANVERLKSEYNTPEALKAGFNWANSKFANFGAPGQPGPQGQAQTNPPPAGTPPPTVTSGGSTTGTPSDAAWRTAISNTTQTPGAPPVSAQTTQNTSPGMGSGAVTGATAAAAAQTGQPAGGPSFYGQAPGMIASSPDLAYRALIEKMGIDPTVHGQFTEYLKSRLGGATQAILNSMRSNGQLPGDINTALAQIGQQAFGQGGNWMDYTGQIADNALKNVGNAYGSNATAQTVESYIQSLLGLKSEGLNPVAASGLSNSFNDSVGAYTDAALQNGGVDKSNFLPYFMKTQLYNKLVPGAPQP